MYLNTPAFCVEEVSSSVRVMMTRDGGIQVERMMCHIPEYSSILCGGGEQLCEGDDDHLTQRHHARLVHLL